MPMCEMIYMQVGPALCCVPLMVWDFRRRRVAATWLGVLGMAALVAGWYGEGGAVIGRVLCNALVLVFLAACMGIYFRLRYGKSRGRWRWFLGAGDVWFVGALTPLFAPEAFVRFLIVACLAALGWYVCRYPRRRTIPFVGIAGAVFIGRALFYLGRAWLA